MSDYRNYRINSFIIPEIDDKTDEPTGVNLVFEVISQETVVRTTDVSDSGPIQQQEIVWICFLNMEGRPKKIYIINPNELKPKETLIVKGYTNENQKFRNSRPKDREKSN